MTRKTIAMVRTENQSACTHYRLNLPYLHCKDVLAKEGIDLVIPEPFHETDAYDAAIYYRCLDAKGMTLPLKRLLEGKAVYWDTDDHYSAIPAWSQAAKEFDSLDRLGWLEGTGMARRVAVSMPALGEVLVHRKTNPIDVLPNLIQPVHLPPRPIRTAVLRRLLWTGSFTHEEDLRAILPAFREARKEFGRQLEIIIYGYCPDWLAEDDAVRPIHIGYSHLRNYPYILRDIGADVAVCPLATDERSLTFNRCKSPIKWMECSLYGGSLVVAQDLEPYNRAVTHGVNGFLAKTESDWTEQILRALSMPADERGEVVRMARMVIDETYSWASWHRRDLWLDWFRTIAEEV